MKIKTFIISTFAMLAALTASARVNEYAVKVGQFDRLQIDDNVNVVYRCHPDSTGYASWRGDTEFDNSFIFTNTNGKLQVQVHTEDVNNPGLPTLYLYSDFLTSVASSSVLTTRIENPAPSPQFKVVLIGNGSMMVHGIKTTKLETVLNTGNGSIALTGSCRQASYKMIGTGTIQADLLEADKVKCTIIGSGSIGCWPVEELRVTGIGSTKIYYRGSPDVHKTGGGKLFRIQEGAQ